MAEQMSLQEINRLNGDEFKSVMLETIKSNFADILTKEDLKLLESGDEGLHEIAEKYHAKYSKQFQ